MGEAYWSWLPIPLRLNKDGNGKWQRSMTKSCLCLFLTAACLSQNSWSWDLSLLSWASPPAPPLPLRGVDKLFCLPPQLPNTKWRASNCPCLPYWPCLLSLPCPGGSSNGCTDQGCRGKGVPRRVGSLLGKSVFNPDPGLLSSLTWEHLAFRSQMHTP